jgi:N-acetyl-beta-hexosaminidase
LSPGARVVIPADRRLASEAAELRRDLRALTGLELPVVSGSAARAGDIVLQIKAHQPPRAESYALEIDSQVVIQGSDAAGVYYGTQTLLQLLKHSQTHRQLPRGATYDNPQVPLRMVMIDAGRRFYEVSHLERLMREMAWLKLNTLHLHLTDWPGFRLRSERFPGLAAALAYDRDDIRRLETTAHRYHITIIPEIDLPAHSAALLRYRPDLAFQCESMRQSSWLTHAAGAEAARQMAWTVDITKSRNRDFLIQLLGEFIPWFSGPYFHIGGDEYQYDADKQRCPELVQAAREHGLTYPGDEFVAWINQADAFVRARGKTTIIWNWWRFKDDATSIEPDKDIIVELWNTPRLADTLAKGYRVIMSPEETLYLDPGIEPDAGKYGIVDQKALYESWSPDLNPAIQGYALSVWADSAQLHTDSFMLGEAYDPMAVVAERLWSERHSGGVGEFFTRLNSIGAAPASVSEH